ncbi:MAG TPA: serine protein kinase RIO, partial [Halieaceae bacterium]|nr:serine protein kinase RIO [Halieaceae bacterium]
YYGLFAPEVLETRYGEEIWQLFEDGELTPEHALTGLFAEAADPADVDSVMLEIRAVLREEEERRERMRDAEDD